METFWAVDWSMVYGVTVQRARRLTEAEKGRYLPVYKEYMMISTGERTPLEHVRTDDLIASGLLLRKPDGEFPGCGNSAYIISDDERTQLIALNERNKMEKEGKERESKIAYYSDIIAACKRQGKLYTPEEAAEKEKRYNQIYNEGGEGFMPKFYTKSDYEFARGQLAELEERS